MHILRSAIICIPLLVFVNQTAAYAERPAKGDGPAVKGKVQEVLDKTGQLGNKLATLCDLACQQTPAGARFHTKVQRLRAAHDRVNSAHGRSDAADFQEFSRKRPKKTDDVQGVVVLRRGARQGCHRGSR